MKKEPFAIRRYGKSELAMTYFPDAASKGSALKRFRNWLGINPRLRRLLTVRGPNWSPRQVRAIVEELGEP